MSEEKKYPKLVIGTFLFNEKGELFLRQSPSQDNKYTCINEKLLLSENFEDVVRESVKKKTNLDVEKIEFIGATNANRQDLGKTEDGEYRHLVFLDYKAMVKDSKKFKQKDERKYKWLILDKWKEKEEKLAPYIIEVIEKLNTEKDDYKAMYLRALADYQNLVRQSAEDKKSFIKYSVEQFLHEIIPVYDNLKFSIGNLSEAEADNAWVQGIKYVIKQFREVLESNGVEEIETEGKEFDHNIMDAVEGQGDKVIKQIKSGYKLNGKVIMAAKVVVG